MKKAYLFIFILFSISGTSCKKFLDEYSQDQIRPGNIADISALMNSDAYPGQLAIDNFDLLTDDIQCNGAARATNGTIVGTYASALQTGMAQFKFDPTMFDQVNVIPAESNVYNICYSKIKGCNVVMDFLDKLSAAETDKNAVLGQCLFLRAYYYLRLVTVYAQPYTKPGQNPAATPGVPLVLTSQVRDGGLARNTLQEVYDQIEKDLLQATALLKQNFAPATQYRAGATAANALLSRFYLYKGDWEKVISYSTQVLQDNNNLLKLSAMVNSTNNNLVNTGLYSTGNGEIIWMYGANNTLTGNYFPTLQSTTGLPPYTVSAGLTALYDKGTNNTNYGDLRYKVYFSLANGSPYYTNKAITNLPNGARGIRVAEMYLNRAEAFIKRGNTDDLAAALADLNTLRESRYDTRNNAYTPVVMSDAAALYSFYQDERRRELCVEEGHRFTDIKRWGLSVAHTFTNADGVTTPGLLQPYSNLYALPIPYTAMNNNPLLQQNPR